MKKLFVILVSPLLMLSCTPDTQDSSDNKASTTNKEEASTDSQTFDYDVEERLKELGIQLVTPNPPTANYLKARRSGNIIYLSGHGPDKPEGGQVIGKVGSDLTAEEGNAAARLVGISLLSSLKAEIGDLNKVTKIIRAKGMVNAIPTFTQHSQVVNGFSDLMVEVFGERGKHVRASIGMSSLPSNIPIEIEMTVEIESSSSDAEASSSDSQAANVDVEKRLEELGIQLKTPAPPTANFVTTRRSGNLVYLSGHGPDKPEGGQVIGKLGSDLTVEEGKAAARLVGIALLSSLKAEIGDLSKVKKVVRAKGMVNAVPTFTQHSQVVNGFSDLMVDVFGQNGKHARSSIGMGSLPGNIPVEIEMTVEIEE